MFINGTRVLSFVPLLTWVRQTCQSLRPLTDLLALAQAVYLRLSLDWLTLRLGDDVDDLRMILIKYNVL